MIKHYSLNIIQHIVNVFVCHVYRAWYDKELSHMMYNLINDVISVI